MATENLNSPQQALGALRSVCEQAEELTQRLTQLDAMVAVTYGEQGEAFRNMNDNLQDNFLWGVSTITEQLQKASEKLARDIHAVRKQVAA